MKTVWILNHYAQEPGGPGGTRHYSLARHLPAHGWRAVILAASTEHNTGRQRLEPHELARTETFDGVLFRWLRTPSYRGNGTDRLRNMLAYTRGVLQPATTRGMPAPDAVIGSSVHPLAALAGLRLARRHRVPFLFEVRDLWPQTLIDMGRIAPHGPAAWVLRRLERHLYANAARIVVLLPHAAEYIQPLGVPVERIAWIPNGVDLDAWPAPEAPAGSGPFTLMYLGAHGPANGLDTVLRAMHLLEQGGVAGAPGAPGTPGAGAERVPANEARSVPASRDGRSRAVRLRLVGDGPRKAELVHLAEELGLRSVSFELPVPKRAVPALAAEADAFVFNLVDAPVFRYGVSPNKLFDFMAAARPVIYCSNARNDPVRKAGAGLSVPPGDPRALAEAIARLAALPAGEHARMGAAGRAYVEHHHAFTALAGRLAQVLEESCAATDARGPGRGTPVAAPGSQNP